MTIEKCPHFPVRNTSTHSWLDFPGSFREDFECQGEWIFGDFPLKTGSAFLKFLRCYCNHFSGGGFLQDDLYVRSGLKSHSFHIGDRDKLMNPIP